MAVVHGLVEVVAQVAFVVLFVQVWVGHSIQHLVEEGDGRVLRLGLLKLVEYVLDLMQVVGVVSHALTQDERQGNVVEDVDVRLLTIFD